MSELALYVPFCVIDFVINVALPLPSYVPVTPKIVTSFFILLAEILLSIAAVTAATFTGEYPSVPLGAVIVCADVVGVTFNDVITGALPLGILDIAVARLSIFCACGKVPPLLSTAV